MTVFLVCACWMVPGWAIGSACGPRWLRALARWWRRHGRPDRGYRPRHDLGARDAGGLGEVMLSVTEDAKLAALVARFGDVGDEIAPEIGALVADHIRLHELGSDLEMTRVQLAIVDGFHAAARGMPELLKDPGYTGALAIAVNTVFELSALYRATV